MEHLQHIRLPILNWFAQLRSSSDNLDRLWNFVIGHRNEFLYLLFIVAVFLDLLTEGRIVVEDSLHLHDRWEILQGWCHAVDEIVEIVHQIFFIVDEHYGCELTQSLMMWINFQRGGFNKFWLPVIVILHHFALIFVNFLSEMYDF